MLRNSFQRSLMLIGAALALPIIVLVVVQLAFSLSREREDVERAALARAEQVNLLIDARLDADLAVMRVMSTAASFQHRDWPGAEQRAREVEQLNPHWRNVIVTDAATGRTIFAANGADPNVQPAINGPIYGGVARAGPGCPCIYLNLPLAETPGYVLTVAISTDALQSILMQRLPDGAVAAVADAQGNFIARSVNYETRVGTPATDYVRNAIASGDANGAYSGKTYEGFDNITVFQVSPVTGWSTHIAVAATLVTRPRTFSFVAPAIGALLALSLGAALIAYALTDLARRRRADERLAQTQKLEAIGQLTGGVAHDFNNLLTVMIGGANMLLRRLKEPEHRQIAEHMLEAAKRGDKLTKQLLAFSRGKRLELAPVDLHALMHGMDDLLRKSIEPGVTLDIKLDPAARWAMSDANQLELAILNLAINARDAMPGGGRVEIAVRPDRDPHHVQITVSDNGIGMPKDVAERAVEPFFTTKPAGKGTGLGLAQVYGAVRQSGGAFEIESAPDQGTLIRLTLPRAVAPAPEPAVEAPAALALTASAAGQTILVVDDEPGVRAFMADTLRQAGYDAQEAQDAGVALAKLESEPPDLLVTDYSMPGMTGLELAERARAKTPGLKVLIVSGYADAAIIERSAARARLLRKPFDEAALVNAVETVLSK